MTYTGLIIGAVSFLTIGMFHPLVIRAEYRLGSRCWWLFLVAGAACIGGSLMVRGWLVSTLLGVVGFSCLWSIHEVIKQRERVEKGWFAEGPGHKAQKVKEEAKKGRKTAPQNDKGEKKVEVINN